MDTTIVIPTFIFVFITTYTPGPNNILAGSLGVLYGYRRTFPFLAGVTFGMLLILLICSSLSLVLNKFLPIVSPFLRVIGALYILWLAYKISRTTNLIKQPEDSKPLKFIDGLLLQFINPKAVFYGLTLFTTFLISIINRPITVIYVSGILALVTFSAISTWTIGGNFIRKFLNTPQRIKVFSITLSLALIYSAIDILGIFG